MFEVAEKSCSCESGLVESGIHIVIVAGIWSGTVEQTHAYPSVTLIYFIQKTSLSNPTIIWLIGFWLAGAGIESWLSLPLFISENMI